MASVVIAGDTSGTVTLAAPAVAGTTTLTLPTANGTLALTSQLPTAPSAVGQIPFSTDGSTYTPTAKIVSGTAVNSTSGTSIDFTSIPSWVKRITVMFNGVSLNGSANFLIQLGDSGGVETTGYNSSCIYGGTAAGTGASTSGFLSINGLNTNAMSGAFTFTNLSGNIWTMTGMTANDGGTVIVFATGSKTLSATLDRVRITTTNGTDTFDAGTINILYE